ncbi:MAG: PhoP regulatory network YrbL family protein [Desulfuromonadales bacterium]|nr:PhoP regulatory network YrbL family protein [Desulfuromonadales bacterium]
MNLLLSPLKPFAQGGNRLCYVHPEDSKLCIKVRRPDFTLADRRRKKGFLKKIRPLSSFDDNLEEFKVMGELKKHYAETIFQHISRCYGFVETDMGKGLVSELIRNTDHRISQTLKKYIWEFGVTGSLKTAIESLLEVWKHELVPSRDLLLHNIVVQQDAEKIIRLVVIDGLGNTGLIPLRYLPRSWQMQKIERKIANFYERIELLLSQRGGDVLPGYHGELLHDGVSDVSQEIQ